MVVSRHPIHSVLFFAFTAAFLLCSDVLFCGEADQSATPVAALNRWLEITPLSKQTLVDLKKQSFASKPISKAQAHDSAEALWKSRVEVLRQQRATEFKTRKLQLGPLVMPFWYRVFGEKPKAGRSLYISLHGGGGTTARINDSQYENQKKLYQPAEGVYLVPRAPTNTWNLWHQSHIDEFLDRLITDMIIFEDVNPDRVCLMGYSAGGDAVFQLAPRMADRFAAASAMAGHPNETKPDGLRNIGFTIHMGEKDAAYNRNKVASKWKQELATLHRNDSPGYQHHVQIHAGRGHWMNLEDAVAVPWMAKFTRNRYPIKIVWRQDDVTHARFYWLRMSNQDTKGRPRVVVSKEENTIQVQEAAISRLTILVHDDLVDLDRKVSVTKADAVLYEGDVDRTISTIADTLLERDDPGMVAFGKVELNFRSD